MNTPVTISSVIARLPERRRLIYDYMCEFWEARLRLPTRREIASEFNIALHPVQYHIEKLIDADLLRRNRIDGKVYITGAMAKTGGCHWVEPKEGAFATPGGRRKKKEEVEDAEPAAEHERV